MPEFSDRAGWADVRFSERHRPEDDVATGILRQVSVGYTVQAVRREDIDPATGERTKTGTFWTPYEISLVPIGADAGATTRGLEDNMTALDTQTAAPAENGAQLNSK